MAGRWLLNLLLALVLLGLALLIRAELDSAARPETLAGIAAEDVRLIAIERPGEPAIRLERTPAGWRMTEPMKVDGDSERMADILKVLDAQVVRSFPAQAAALGELGLAPPGLVLRLDTLELAFGGLDPLSQLRYVASEGLVHLIEDRFQHLLIAPAIDQVSRAPLPSGRAPAFGTLSGIPLAGPSLEAMARVRAERVEVLTGELAGEALQVKYPDGNAVRFLISEDRRRWARLDLKLNYVVTDPIDLKLDPTAVDTTPPEPEPQLPEAQPSMALPMPGDDAILTDDPQGYEVMPVVPLSPAPEPDPADPFAPRPDYGGAPVGPDGMPEVRLSPDDVYGAPYGGDPYLDGYDGEVYEEGGFGAEPYKDPPQGFGTDPFAPDPAYDPDAAGY